MALADEIDKSVRLYSALPLDRLHVISHFDELPLARIHCGIVYFLAPWSVPSVMYFRAVTAALSRMDCSNLDIYVVHIDCVPDEYMQHVFQRRAPAGAGETLWVRDGAVVDSVLTYPRAEAVAEFTRRTRDLLDQPAAERTGCE